jgi:RNA polymerase sigma-70 factor (ECF subfamily)
VGLWRNELAAEVPPGVGVTAGSHAALDETAFRGLYDTTARAIWAYLYRTLGSAPDADDLVQEVFLRYVKSPLQTRDLAENRAYLFRIAGNLAIDHWRRRGTQPTRDAQPLEDDIARTGPPGDRLALKADMAKVFRELKPRERTMIWLSCVEGESAAEIAKAVGVGRNSVPVLLFRARTKLARLLRRAGWEG